MRLLGVALLLVVACLPPPVAHAASGWGVDAEVSVTSATSADYTWKIGTTNVRLPLPDNATFVEARDADGKAVSARMEGDQLVLSGGRVPITARFTLEGQRDGPFSIFPAQVASAGDSPVTVKATLGAGWTLAGYRDSDQRKPDAGGVFHGTGPAYVQFLVLQPGFTDPGRAAGVAGSVVRREGGAQIGATSATWSLATTYDTEVYSRSWEVHVPDGAIVTAATSPFGPLATAREGDVLRVTTPYPVGFGLGARTFVVNMTLPAPVPHGGTFRVVNLSVRAAEHDDVRIRATLAPGLQYTGARLAEHAVETEALSFRATGPLTVGVAFLPPAAPGHAQFTEGLFVVDAPNSIVEAARATARNASELLPRVAGFVYDGADTRPFYVAYTDADVFGWEEGFFSNGLNTITIRASTLADAADAKPHLLPVGVLVHEATHGLVDRRLPDAPHNLSFLHEGLSRLAETHVEAFFPASEIIEQDGLTFTRHSARPSADDLRAYHVRNELFDVAWHASAVDEADRGTLYDYSGLVLHAFERRAPPFALANALAHVNGTKFTGDDLADSQLLLDIFLANTPGTSPPAFLYPGREAAGLSIEEFRHCLNGLVAPPYQWEESRAPRDGCPSNGYGARDAPLPTPPVKPITSTPEPPPIVESAPPSEPSAPAPPSTQTPVGEGDTPGAIVEGSDPDAQARPGSATPAAIPGPSALVVMLSAFALAVTTRRRS